MILTMLIVSITLAISFSIYSISIKEVVLGSYIRESEKAFLAADRGMECALFWDRAVLPGPNGLQYSPFPTSTDWTDESIITANAVCNLGGGTGAGTRIDSSGWVVSGLTANQGFTIYNQTFTDGTYAEIEVEKAGINTIITSNGYNTPPAGARRTQRTIVARYNL